MNCDIATTMPNRVTSLAPIVDEHTAVLILGSMPGKRSLEVGQYYANERNNFWRIVHEIYGFEPAPTYMGRVAFLRERNIGLWDVLRECYRKSSMDSDIKDPVPNDLNALLIGYPRIRCLFFNGTKAMEAFDSSVEIDPSRRSTLHIALLPSTSPANTHSSIDAKLELWRAVRRCAEAVGTGR